ncbi:MAG: response regulator [Arcobacter sp.]|uniref:response regulator n=1 Tax=Arcobacter sp. TaxID=1872629 RepID=UPI003AFFCC33
MDNINEFIKKLKILYVEDEEQARIMFSKFLNKKFEISISCSNGLEAYEEYIKAEKENVPFDLIISDINMPKINGIELLEKIRDLNNDIPFIFTTARTESEQMIKAINLNAHAYLLKPIDFSLIDKTIEKICMEIYYKKNYELQKKETEAYLSILNKEAIVTKTDFNGNITFVNDAFLDISGYTEDEVMGQNHSILKHPDSATSLYKELWNTIKSGKAWEGTLKNKSKNGEAYFINTKIIPIYDDTGKSIVEFISVRFAVTQEENQRRAQNKRFIEQVTIYKKELSKIKKEKEELSAKFNNTNYNVQLLKDKLTTYENKIKNLLSQLSAYETQNIKLNKMDLMMKQDKKKQFDIISKDLIHIKNHNKSLTTELEELKKTLEHKEKNIETLEEKRIQHEKRIADLLDLVNNLQKEVKVLKGELVEGDSV